MNYSISNPVDISYLMCTAPDCDHCRREKCLLEDTEILLDKEISIVLPGRGTLHIARGFKWDGASIPRPFWSACYHPLHHRIIAAALAHDAIYQAEIFERSECDDIFLEMLQAWGVSWYQRNKMWLAVRAAGGSVWKRHTAESIAEGRKYVTFEAFA